MAMKRDEVLADGASAAEVGRKRAGLDQKAKAALTVSVPHFQVLHLKLVGTAPLVVNRFSAREEITLKQEEGSTAASKKVRAPKDFDARCKAALHIDRKGGWCGFPAAAFRAGAVRASSAAGVKMTMAKMAFFVLADGLSQDGAPLVRINGEWHRFDAHARNDNGSVDIRARPMFDEWTINLRVEFDADLLKAQDVVHLMMRLGRQVGLGDGRPFSRESTGMGWGTFNVELDVQLEKTA